MENPGVSFLYGGKTKGYEKARRTARFLSLWNVPVILFQQIFDCFVMKPRFGNAGFFMEFIKRFY